MTDPKLWTVVFHDATTGKFRIAYRDTDMGVVLMSRWDLQYILLPSATPVHIDTRRMWMIIPERWPELN